MSNIIVKEADPIIGRCLEAIDAIKRSGKEETEYTAGYEAGKAVGILEGVIADMQRREKKMTIIPADLGVQTMLPNAFLSLGPEGVKLEPMDDDSDEDVDEPLDAMTEKTRAAEAMQID